MQRFLSRRIAGLEESLLPLSPRVFMARADAHARSTRISFWQAFESLLTKVSDEDLEGLTIGFEKIAFGNDTAARDAAKRKVFAAAGYPDWTPPQEAN